MRRTPRARFAKGAGLALACLLGAARVQAGESCVECHRGLAGAPMIGHSFKEWEHSPHATAGINCQHCHGGDPAEGEADAAHEGISLSGDKKSPLYFTNIPEFCGGCHGGEFKAFKESRHFKELQRTGGGPNCLTCHGAMAASIPSPSFLQATCTNCHRKPLKVFEALSAFTQLRRTLSRLDELAGRGRKAGKVLDEDERAIARVNAEYADLQRSWHSFRMGKVQERIVGASRDARTLVGNLTMRLKTE